MAARERLAWKMAAGVSRCGGRACDDLYIAWRLKRADETNGKPNARGRLPGRPGARQRAANPLAKYDARLQSDNNKCIINEYGVGDGR